MPRCAVSSALMTPSIGRCTSLTKTSLSFIESSLLFQDVLGSVVLIVLESPEQYQRRPQRVGLLISARKEHEHRLARYNALQIIEHVVRADVREDLADTGEEEDVEVALGELGADRGRDVELRVEHPLEQLAEVVLLLLWFEGGQAVPDAGLFEDLNRQVV